MLKDFESLLNQFQNRLNTIRSMIQTNEKLREIIYGDKLIQEELQELKKIVPDSTKWRIYDHCAAVTQLYSIYEGFVEESIKSWIRELPEIYPNYLDLKEKIRKTHEIGIAEIIKSPRRFGELSVEQLIRKLYLAFTSNSGLNKYELVSEAFLLHEQNLRKDTLDKLFADAGISNAWKWIKKHRIIKGFEKEILTGVDTTEFKLKELIDYRNEASHGYSIDQILKFQDLIDLCDFIESLSQAIVELINYNITQAKIYQGQAKRVGKIINWFEKAKAFGAEVYETNLSVGNTVVLTSETKSYCQLAQIENIQINGVDQKAVEIKDAKDIGIKFNIEIESAKGLEIVIFK